MENEFNLGDLVYIHDYVDIQVPSPIACIVGTYSTSGIYTVSVPNNRYVAYRDCLRYLGRGDYIEYINII